MPHDQDTPEETPEETLEQRQEAALVQRFEEEQQPPSLVKRKLERMEDLREYVHTTAMLLDEEDAVGTNFLLRNIYTLVNQLAPQDPAPRFQVQEKLADPAQLGTPLTYSEAMTRHARTHEILVARQQEWGGLEHILTGAIQDALTVGWAWIKVRWQEDPTSDALGYARENDQLDSITRFRYLKQLEEEGELDEHASEWEEIRQLAPIARQAMIEVLKDQMDDQDPSLILPAPEDLGLQDIPEVPHFRSFNFQQVEPEDMRWDWNIFRFEDLRFCRWMAHRAYMDPEEVQEKWGLTDDQLKAAVGASAALRQKKGEVIKSSGQDTRDNRDDVESDHQGEQIAVWERWDRELGKVFVWIAGLDFFVQEYVPPATGKRFFPFFALTYGRVTGKMLGPSETELQQPLQDEINRLRTHDREARNSAYPRYIVRKGLMRNSEKRKLQNAMPYEVVELDSADEIRNAIHELVPSNYDPRLYDRTSAFLDMQVMAGIPLAASGGVGSANLATEAAIANEQMGITADRRRNITTRVLAEIYEFMAQVNAQLMPEANVKEIVGAGAIWPALDRQKVLENFLVDVRATLVDAAERRQFLQERIQIAQLMGQIGLPINPIEFSKDLLEMLGHRVNLARWILDPQTLQALAASGIGSDRLLAQAAERQAAAPPIGSLPTDQAGAGVQGGRPPMQEPPFPEQVPGPQQQNAQ